MLSKKTPILLAIIITAGLFWIFPLDKDISYEGGIDVDLGFGAEIIASEYSIVDGDSKKYIDSQNRFSFRYPSEFSLGQFGDEEVGETVLLQRAEEQAGFQVFISLFDEPGRALTVERIKSEIPSLVMIDPRDVDFQGEVIGISFLSESEAFGRSREIWIAKAGFLYQMSSYESEQTLLAEVLSSWSFN